MTEVVPHKSTTFEDKDDAEAKRLMAEWGMDNSVHSADLSVASEQDDDSCVGYDDYLERFRREVNPGDKELDHIVLGTSNLDAAVVEFEKMTGMKPVMVVSLKGVGTKSARIAFEDCSFLEIIGPDPKQKAMPLSTQLSKITPGKLVPLHYAVRDSEARANKPWVDVGLSCDRVTMLAVDRNDSWKWDMSILGGHDKGGLVPYFVDWGDAHHASGRLPILGSLDRVLVQSSSGSPIHDLLSDIDGVDVREGDDLLEFVITSPKGKLTFSTAMPLGISFPGI